MSYILLHNDSISDERGKAESIKQRADGMGYRAWGRGKGSGFRVQNLSLNVEHRTLNQLVKMRLL
jgi:hypothetical protein